MAAAAHVYTKFMSQMAGGDGGNIGTDALKVMLLSAYIPGTTQDNAQFVSDILAVASESSGTGYTAGGLLLSAVTITETASTHLITVSCSSPTWTTLTTSAAYALFYDSTPGSNATNPVICYWDFGGTQAPVGANFQLLINASGLLTLTGS